ncbi:hypothetical protein B0T14DRAFT_237405 [Immersiella caudata]|uniref:Uncharacterized protein n=1 Tax=Immersiella caudata TaxID=314043 RepID=A0AA40C123_9PEZI|nr:hypothetical protein B0T14DRAFT_237405 [Immersiella caudata]
MRLNGRTNGRIAGRPARLGSIADRTLAAKSSQQSGSPTASETAYLPVPNFPARPQVGPTIRAIRESTLSSHFASPAEHASIGLPRCESMMLMTPATPTITTTLGVSSSPSPRPLHTKSRNSHQQTPARAKLFTSIVGKPTRNTESTPWDQTAPPGSPRSWPCPANKNFPYP